MECGVNLLLRRQLESVGDWIDLFQDGEGDNKFGTEFPARQAQSDVPSR